MKVESTGFEGLLVISPQVFADERGYFMESFNLDKFFRQSGIKVSFVQDNEAQSNAGVIRGLHYQLGPFAQSKLVRVIKGKVLDVVVDLRKETATYGKSFSIELSGENKKQLFIPKGFAHGYAVLEDATVFAYKCDAFYQKTFEAGINIRDASLGIRWPFDEAKALVSEKDRKLPRFGEHIALNSY
jgi:dTDP-4-dehydrorhamnose 3,5-epimerase